MVRLLVRVGGDDGGHVLQLVRDQLEAREAEAYSATELAVRLCRCLNVVESRELCVTKEDVFINLALANAKQKHQSCESVMASEVLYSLFKLKKQTMNDEAMEDPVLKEYTAMMRRSKLTDVFDLFCKLKVHKEELKTLLMSPTLATTTVLLIVPQVEKHFLDQELIEFFASLVDEVHKVVLETPLDASLHDDEYEEQQTHSTVVLEPFDVSSLSSVVSSSRISRQSRTDAETRYSQSWMEGCLRLLVNTRDDLALAKVLNGPVVETIDHEAFTTIRKLAHDSKQHQPMFQAVVSYVQRCRLGSSTTSSLLNEFGSGLCDVVNHVDRMREMMEDIDDKELFKSKITRELRKQLVKSKASLSNEALEKALVTVNEAFHKASTGHALNRDEDVKQTGKTTVSPATSKNLKVVRDAVDTLTTGLPSDQRLRWSVLLGKIEPEFVEARSPLGVPSLVKLFATPGNGNDEEEEGMDGDEFKVEQRSLAERMGLKQEHTTTSVLSPGEQERTKQGLPRFKAALTWAPEYSPINDEEEGIKRFMVKKEKKQLTENQLLLRKLVREEQIASRRVEAAIAACKKLPKPPKRSRKRSLLEDILKPSKKALLDTKCSKSGEVEKGKKPQQTKLTSFFKSN